MEEKDIKELVQKRINEVVEKNKKTSIEMANMEIKNILETNEEIKSAIDNKYKTIGEKNE